MDHAQRPDAYDGWHGVLVSTLALRRLPAWRDLLTLTKPGILLGNLIAVLGGYGLAAIHHPDTEGHLLSLLVGSGMIIAAAGVFNNLLDQDMDRLMTRTQDRCQVLTRISVLQGFIWGILLLTVGSIYLISKVNVLTLSLAWGGLFVYLVPYTLHFKRRSWTGLWVGALAGATPPLMGYCALIPHLDHQAIWLFVCVCLWQIPHAHAIALRHLEDYRRANLALLPITHGTTLIRQRMPWYIGAFTLIACLPIFWDNNTQNGIITGALGIFWELAAWRWRTISSTRQWATRHFQCSLGIILLFNLSLIAPLIPW